MWIHQDGIQGGVIVCLAMQQQDARLCSDDHPYLIAYFQTATALKRLFIQEHLDVPSQLGLIFRCQPVIIGHVILKNVRPGLRERPIANSLTPLFFQSEHSVK